MTHTIDNRRRDGDPIADVYSVRIYDNGACFAIADGCGWGPRSFKAATKAIEGYSDYADKNIGSIENVRDAARFLLRAMCKAHEKIWEPPAHHWEVGSTTLLGAVLLKLDRDDSSDSESSFGPAPYVLVCSNIGDCKAFVISGGEDGEVYDVTVESKRTVKEKCDPGGRIGPYLDGNPDTRNLLLSTIPIFPGDTIVLVSDGVHDNLDPETLGLPLSKSIKRNVSLAQKLLKLDVDEVTQKINIPPDYETNKAWEAITIEQSELLKTEYREHLVGEFFASGASAPSQLLAALFEHCTKSTKASREFMELDPSKVHPPDYEQYPGKMDHTTGVIYRVPGDPPADRPTHPHVVSQRIETFRMQHFKEDIATSPKKRGSKTSSSPHKQSATTSSTSPTLLKTQETELPPRKKSKGTKSSSKKSSQVEESESVVEGTASPSKHRTSKDHAQIQETNKVEDEKQTKSADEALSKSERQEEVNRDELISSESS
jgi:serine/threonine protein phosphatase PrpC